jgi:uncharacterized protein (TIGR02145 family)
MNISPNPVLDKCFIELYTVKNGNVKLELFDIAGREITKLECMLNKGKSKLELRGMGTGLYILKCQSDNYSASVKIISNGSNKEKAEIRHIASEENIIPEKERNYNLKSNKSLADMEYTAGDVLKLTGITEANRDVIYLIPKNSQKITLLLKAGCGDVTDNDGHIYSTIQYGSQCWMKENLNTGKFVNSTLTGSLHSDLSNNAIIEKYCYDDYQSNCDIYGGLYDWNEMMGYVKTEGARGICPEGWHIPSDAECQLLVDYFGGNSLAGGKMKTTGTIEDSTGLWLSPNTGATDESGFSMLPGGRRNFDGDFVGQGKGGVWWSSSEFDSEHAWDYDLFYLASDVGRFKPYKVFGFSVRCVKD